MSLKKILSAVFAAAASAGTALTALWVEKGAESFGDVSDIGYAIVAVGAIVAIAKDLQSSMRDSGQ